MPNKYRQMACKILQISAIFAWITFVIQWAFVNFHGIIAARLKSLIVGRLFVCCTLNDIQCFIPRLRYIFSCKPTIKTEIRYFVWMNILSMISMISNGFFLYFCNALHEEHGFSSVILQHRSNLTTALLPAFLFV